MAKMDDSELLAIIADHESRAIGNSSQTAGVGIATATGVGPNGATLTTVEIDRYNALNYYNGLPFGNEQNDRSQVVLPELRDTVEWLLPQLMRMYASTQTIATFDPRGPGDEKYAEQESDAVNYVFLKQNQGFNILYDAFKDALLLKNYYLKAGWEKKRHTSVESYSNLSKDELTKLFVDAKENGDELEIIDQSEHTIMLPNLAAPPAPAPGQPPLPPPPPVIPLPVIDIRIRRISYKGQVVVQCVAPEDMRISSRARSDLNDSPFTAQVTRLTRSDLLEMGYDRATVMSLPAARPDWIEMDKLARDTVIDEMSQQAEADPSTVEVELKECYLKVDYDQDDVAELRRVLFSGTSILENEEVPFVPYSSGVPCRMSHRHVGVSMYDLMGDLQLIKSTIFRGVLDNGYLINNTQTAVNELVNYDDLLTRRPGGIVRIKGETSPAEALMPFQTQNALGELMEILPYVDSLRTMRTGVGENTLGLDPDALQNVTNPNGAAMLSAAMLKIEMMAMLLGEGIKDMFQKIHALLIMHQDQKMDIQLRGEWLQVDPSQWRTRTAVTLHVGLGSGNRQESRMNAQAIAQAQGAAAQMGLVGPQQAYNTAIKLIESMGWQNGKNTYFMDPGSPEYQQAMQQKQQAQAAQAQADPRLQAVQGQLRLAQFKAQAEAQQQQVEGQREQAEILLQARKDAQQIQTQAALDMQKAQLDAQLEAKAHLSQAVINFVEAIAVAAIKANAQPQAIQTDVSAAEAASRQIQ